MISTRKLNKVVKRLRVGEGDVLLVDGDNNARMVATALNKAGINAVVIAVNGAKIEHVTEEMLNNAGYYRVPSFKPATPDKTQAIKQGE